MAMSELPSVVRGSKNIMIDSSVRASRDWLGNTRASLLAWWIPRTGIIAGLFMPVSVRTVIWIVSLTWMGLACILNAQRCGRTHCRYTGPFFLAMILPVLVLGTVGASTGLAEWIALGVLIEVGGRLLWWATERAWGTFQ
jgi:hypothetical protein